MNSNQKKRLSELFTAHAADSLTQEEHAELQALLRNDTEARRWWFVHQDVEIGLRAQVAAERLTVPKARVTLPWLSWRPLAAAAAGIVFGMFCTSVVFAYTQPRSPVMVSKVLPLADADFESGSQVPAQGIPSRASAWSGDYSRVVAAENSITPKHGNHMLRLLRSDNELSAKNERSYVGSAAQVIDLRPLRAELSGADRVAEVSAHFNSIPPPLGERYEFAIKTASYHGDIADAPQLWEDHQASLSRSDRCVVADSDVTTWQRVAVPLVVPPDADFLVIECAAVRKSSQAGHGATEFPGHYVDQVEAQLNSSRDLGP